MNTSEDRTGLAAQCGLCGTALPDLPSEIVQGRAYYHCLTCDLLQMAHQDRLNAREETARYLKHNNSLRTRGYTSFLERLILPVIQRLDRDGGSPGLLRGLDFGSGPYPMLAELMEECGYAVEIYDPLFAPRDRASLLSHSYDFILCCETAEHFYRPAEEFGFMKKLLARHGFIGIMTSLRSAGLRIDNWHYAQDETHVALYSKESMHWIAKHFGLDISFPARDIVFLESTGSSA